MGHPLFATKPVQDGDDAAHGPQLKRTLSAIDLTLLGIGCIVGTGIFVLTGTAAARYAGPALAISFALAAVPATLGALCYAEMASMIPAAGSAYAYAYATLGELLAFIIGWDLILEWLIGAAAVSIGWSSYVTGFIHHLTGSSLPAAWCNAPLRWESGGLVATGGVVNLPAVLIVLAITTILVFGVRTSTRLNAKIVAVKLGAIFLFIAFASAHIQPENWHPFVPPNTGEFGAFGISGILRGATLVFFSYLGFDAVSVAAQETRNPSRDVPIGLFASLFICTILYMSVSLILTGIVPYRQLDVASPMAVGIAATGLTWLEPLIEIGAIAGLTSVILVMLFAQPRILYAMACDGLLPASFARVHPVYHTPHVITVITGLTCAVAAGLLPIQFLAELTSVGTLFAFVLVGAGVTVLRLRRPDLPRKFKVPGGPFLVPMGCVLCSVALMAVGTQQTLWRLGAWMLLGLLIYAFYGRQHSKLRRRAVSEAGSAQPQTP